MSIKQNSVKPTFINIGPGRCATSWLFEVFKAHPEITMAQVKETEYFNTRFQEGHAWYESNFPATGNACVGEISNNYYLDPEVAGRIHDYNPAMKLIVNLRDPFDLMQSFYGFGVRRGLDLDGLASSLEQPIGRLMGSGYDSRARKKQLTAADQYTLLESVMLADRIRPFLETFGPESVYVFVYERLRNERSKVLAEIYDFLGVDSAFVPPVSSKVVNASIEPKSKLIARCVPYITFQLRQMGFNGLLSRLHRSDLIKKVLYRETASLKEARRDPREEVDAESKQILDLQIEWLKANVDAIGGSWDRPSQLPNDAHASLTN